MNDLQVGGGKGLKLVLHEQRAHGIGLGQWIPLERNLCRRRKGDAVVDEEDGTSARWRRSEGGAGARTA